MAPSTLDDFERFEQAWKHTPQDAAPPLWLDFLPKDLSETPHVLLTLFLETDIEKRIKSNRSAILQERYWEHPHLGVWTPVQRVELVQFELAQRRRAGAACSVGEYVAAFPDLAGVLAELPLNTPSPNSRETPSGHAADSAVPDDAPPKVPGYILQERLGAGGMGVVWRAKDLSLERDVAVKMLKADFLTERYRQSGSVAGRFLDEARITGQLQHPGIPAVYQVGSVSERPFFAMKLVKGRSLDKMLKDKTHINVLAVFEQIAQAIGYAHAHGVIHRDLKPANVMVGAFGEVQVMDWGLAKVLGTPEVIQKKPAGLTVISSARDSDHATSYGSLLGTPAFTPPEQAVGEIEQMSERSDVFGLGAILCNLLTGHPPYVGKDEKETQLLAKRGKLEGAYERLAACGGDPDLIGLCLKCLQSDPVDRLPHGTDVATAVGKLREESEQRAQQAELDRARAEVRVEEQKARRRTQLSFGGAVVASLVILGSVAAWQAWQATDLAGDLTKQKERADEATVSAENKAKAFEKAQKLAEKEAANARREKAVADKQRVRAESLVYAGRLDMAFRRWAEGRMDIAFQELNDCRWDYRGWEHDFRFSQFTGNHVLLPGHIARPTAVAFSPDGQRIVSASYDGILRVLEARTGKLVKELRVPSVGLAKVDRNPDSIAAVAYSPDGKRIASAGSDKALRIWDADTLELLQTLASHEGSIHCLAFSPDSATIATGAADTTLRLWDYRKGNIIATLRRHGGDVMCVAFSPDGKKLLSGSTDLSLREWDAATGEHLREFATRATRISGVAYSPDGSLVAACGTEEKIGIYDAVRGRHRFDLTGHGHDVTGIAFSPDGTRLASGGVDASLRVWDLGTRETIATYKGHVSRIQCLAFHPDGTQILSGSGEDALRLWDVRGEPNAYESRSHKFGVLTVATSPDGKWIVTGGEDSSLKLWDARSGGAFLGEFLGHDGSIECAAFDPDSNWIATGGQDKLLRIWYVNKPRFMPPLEGHTAIITSVAVSPDGKLIATGSLDQTVRVWDVARRLCIGTLTGHDARVTSVAFSPDSSSIVSGSHDATARIWSVKEMKQVAVLEGHNDDIRSVGFSPDGRQIVSGCHNRSIRIWEVATGRSVLEIKGHTDAVACVAFCPDGQRIISGSWDNTIRVWDARSGACLLELKGHSRPVLAIAYRPDGGQIVSSSSDRTVRLWDARACACFAELKVAHRKIIEAAITPDGKRLVARDREKKISVWDAASGEPLEDLEPEDFRVPWSGARQTSPDGRLDFWPTGDGVCVRFNDKARRYDEFVKDRLDEWRRTAPEWHLRRAVECERASQWSAAAFHYKGLLAFAPNDPRLRALLSNAERNAKRAETERLPPKEQAPPPRKK